MKSLSTTRAARDTSGRPRADMKLRVTDTRAHAVSDNNCLHRTRAYVGNNNDKNVILSTTNITS